MRNVVTIQNTGHRIEHHFTIPTLEEKVKSANPSLVLLVKAENDAYCNDDRDALHRARNLLESLMIPYDIAAQAEVRKAAKPEETTEYYRGLIATDNESRRKRLSKYDLALVAHTCPCCFKEGDSIAFRVLENTLGPDKVGMLYATAVDRRHAEETPGRDLLQEHATAYQQSHRGGDRAVERIVLG